MIDKLNEDSQHLHEASPDIYKLLVESIRDYAIFLINKDGCVQTWNRGAQRLKLYSPEDILGKHFSIFYTEEDRAVGLPARMLKLALENGRAEDEGWRVRKNGTRFWADVVITTIYDEVGTHCGFAKITRDLTERRHLTIAREEALHASNTKSAFLANMSHELRTPLTAIIGYAELIEEEVDEIDRETLRDNLKRILYSGRHLMSIISDILDLSKIEAGRLELQPSQIDLPELLTKLVETAKPLAECNGNSIAVHVQSNLTTIYIDGARLRQLIYNLLSNAAKFTNNGTITIEANRDKSNSEIVTIDITDTGVGMSEEEAASIFDRFRQVEAHVSTHNRGGTGLGLAICRMLSEAMGGTIDVKSVPGKGSTITLRLHCRTQ